jgi:hypothetical protein
MGPNKSVFQGHIKTPPDFMKDIISTEFLEKIRNYQFQEHDLLEWDTVWLGKDALTFQKNMLPLSSESISSSSSSSSPWRSQIATHHVTGHNTQIHNILSTVPQLSIYQKALETLPEDVKVMPKHVGATIHI